MISMPNPLYQRSLLSPNKTALVFEGERLSFEQLHEKVVKRAHTLKKLGVKKESHVGICMNSSAEFVITYFALLYLGAVAVLFNTRLTKEELSVQEGIGDVEFTVIDEIYKGIFQREEVIVSNETSFDGFLKEFSMNQVCSLLFTSGTTGRPKAVQLTFGNHYFSAMSSALNTGIQEDDCYLAVMPLFHVGGLSIFHRSVLYGMKVVLLPKFNTTSIPNIMMQEKVTHASLVTKMLIDLLEIKEFCIYSSKLRSVLLGGGSVPKSLLEKCETYQIPILQTYGMTETASQIVTLSLVDMKRKMGSCGRPLLTTSLKIMKDGKECAPYVEGEIVVKSPTIMKGYYNNEEVTRLSFIDDWFYTGDIGYCDEEGYLYVVDRRKDLIISGGENIYPSEIENVLQMHPFVKEAGVVGKKDDVWGQIPIAYIVSAKPITREEVQQFCQTKLAKYKIPKEIIVVDKLPRTASQKLQRHKLQNSGRELYEN